MSGGEQGLALPIDEAGTAPQTMEAMQMDAVYEETFKNLAPPDWLVDGDDPERPPLEIEPIFPDYPDKGFVAYNVLSERECEYYMEQGESLGMEALGLTYKVEYRNNDRCVVNAPEVSEGLWRRVQELMKTIEVSEVPETNALIGVGGEFGIEGTWEPLELNNVWRLCRYHPGGHFAPHYDGHFRRNGKERSMKTFMLYLNGGFEGGSTNFVDECQMLFRDPEREIFCAEDDNVITRIAPRPGMALIFNHHILHEGQQLESGEKWIMRSDVMYTHASAPAMDAKDAEALLLLQQAEHYETDGEFELATQCYRRAFKMSKRLADQYGQ